MSDDFSSRTNAVTSKILKKVPASQSKVIAFRYDFSTNTFQLHNPYEYLINFLDELKLDEVLAILKKELPLPASPIHVRSTQYLLSFFFFPLTVLLTYYYYTEFFSKHSGRRVWLHILTYGMYVLMILLTTLVHFVFKKNRYFDRMHKREKVMRAIFSEVNEQLYPQQECCWNAGKYGLFFFGTLKHRKSSLA